MNAGRWLILATVESVDEAMVEAEGDILSDGSRFTVNEANGRGGGMVTTVNKKKHEHNALVQAKSKVANCYFKS